MAYFPLFIEIEKKPCLVAGGGRIALHKVQALLDFGAHVTVVSPMITEEIRALGQVCVLEREFRPEDIEGRALVVAATDDTSVNHTIAALCKDRGVLVNAADQIEDCTFIFPAYVRRGDVVAAFSSSGKSPVIAQYLKAEEKEILTELVGELNDFLGSLRGRVKSLFDTEKERKQVYQELLRLGIEKQSVPTDEETAELLFRSDGKKERQKENGSHKKTENK